MRWATCADGHAVAGAGLRAGPDDILKLGRMYFAKRVGTASKFYHTNGFSLCYR